MPSLLETYLAEVAAQIDPLPPKRRDEELREVRAHLEAVFADRRRQGQTEEEAANWAVAQFGSPQAMGQGIAAVWRRGEALSRRSLLGAAFCVLIVRFLLPLFLSPLETAYYNPASPGHFEPLLWASLFFNLAGPLSAGVVGGIFFPKHAVAGTGLASAAYFCLALALGGYWLVHHGPVMFPVSASSVVLSITSQSISDGIVSLLSAWAASRRQVARAGRTRSARG